MSAELSFDQWADAFASQWMKTRPQSATRAQYFEGFEQDACDRDLAVENFYGGALGAKNVRARAGLAERGLDELAAFDRSALSEEQQTSAALIEHRLNDFVRDANFPYHRFIFDSFVGLHLSLITFISTQHPLRNERDMENYGARVALVGQRLDEGIAEAKAAEQAGILPPDFILRRAVEQLDQLTRMSSTENPLVSGLARRLTEAGVAETRRTAFANHVQAEVEASVLPALRRVRDLLADQITRAKPDAGAWRLPDGEAYYAHQLKTITGTAMTAQEIHEIGLREVARIEKEMDGLLAQLGFADGPIKARVERLNESLSAEQSDGDRDAILRHLQEVVDDAQRRSESSFDLRPKAPVVVKREPAYSEKSAAAHYTTPAPDGSQPGIYWAPLADLGPKVMWLGVGTKTTCYHEAIPGHHFQLALQQEMNELPRFRKYEAFGFDIAYVEGWALYAEHFSDEDGWYAGDLPGRIGYLEAQLFRARRLVVDTGMHAFKWNFQRAVDYGFTVAEIERYACWPGQACGYMIGFLHILKMRERSRAQLGDRFSIKEFHNAILRGGSMPLGVLDRAV